MTQQTVLRRTDDDSSSEHDDDIPGIEYMLGELDLNEGKLGTGLNYRLASAPQWNFNAMLNAPMFLGVGELTDEDHESLRRQCSSAPAVLTTFGLELQRNMTAAQAAQTIDNTVRADAWRAPGETCNPWGAAAAAPIAHQFVPQVASGINAQAHPHVHARARSSSTSNLLLQHVQQQQDPASVLIKVQDLIAGLEQNNIPVAPIPHPKAAQEVSMTVNAPHSPTAQPPPLLEKPGPLEVTKVPPCKHNHWERVTKKKNSISLRCRTCLANWKTRLELFEKCTDFYAGHCPKGNACEHPHIYSKAAEKYRSRMCEDAAANAGVAQPALAAAAAPVAVNIG